MPARGRGPRAGGGAQSPEPPSEVRSPRPWLVGRAGGRAHKRERQLWRGGQIKNNPPGLGSSRALSPRSVPEDSRGGGVGEGRAGFPLLRGAGCPPARRGGTCAAPPAQAPCTQRGRPLPRTGRSWQRPPPATSRGWREACHYLLFTSVNRFEALRVGARALRGPRH